MPRVSSLLSLAAAVLVGCSADDGVSPGRQPVEFVSVGLEGTPGWALDDSLAVRVQNAYATPLAGVWVHWSATSDGALFSADSSLTGGDGIARVEFVPGWARGLQRVTATADGRTATLDLPVTSMEFTATEVLDRRACGLDLDGRMWCWPEYSPSSSHAAYVASPIADAQRPVPVLTTLRFRTLRGIATTWGERGFICGITAAGELWCAGPEDFAGPAGVAVAPTLHRVETPVPVADWAGGGNFGENACILDTDGQAWCRGPNAYGQLGDGTTTESDAWRPVQGGLRFAEITVGPRDACAILLNGQPYCWGGNSNARLGITPGVFAIVEPTPIDADIRLKRITQASSGLCGIAAHGTPMLLCWGPIFAARRVSNDAPSGIVDVPATASSLAGDQFGGRTVENGRLYRFGYNGGWVADFQFYDDKMEPDLTGIDRLLSRTSYYWCVRHESGSTICSTVRARPLGVPMPKDAG